MLIFWAVLGGFVLDAIFGDPAWLPHPVVLMGKAICWVVYMRQSACSCLL